MDVTPDLVRRLVQAQFPHWAHLPATPVQSAGVDNAMVRLGDGLVARLPRTADAARSVGKEQAWLPVLGPRLPVRTPRILGVGRPTDEFAYVWSVTDWIEGAPLNTEDADWPSLAQDIAAFLRALHGAPPMGGPAPGAHNFGRGAALASRDAITRDAIAALDGVARGALLSAWTRDASAPAWAHAPRWLHGDFHAHNILARDGQLAAVIDFGGLGVGDPACDVAAAWRLFPRGVRDAFRDALGVDDATWARGRAWALSISVRELAHYTQDDAPELTAIARGTVRAVLEDA